MNSSIAKISIVEIKRYIQNAQQVLQTQSYERGLGGSEYPVLNEAQYGSWRTQVLNYLKSTLSESSEYYLSFKSDVQRGAYPSYLQNGISLLERLVEDINNGVFIEQAEAIKPLLLLNNIFDKFHKVAVQLRKRHDERPTIDVNDEYDVQDLLHALLKLNFDDIQPEDWTPSYAGSSSRLDFALRTHKIIVEVKKTRSSLRNKDAANQLIIDIERYRTYPNCEHLVCFVYDPDGYITNPIGFEKDLSREREDLNVSVIVRPGH